MLMTLLNDRQVKLKYNRGAKIQLTTFLFGGGTLFKSAVSLNTKNAVINIISPKTVRGHRVVKQLTT